MLRDIGGELIVAVDFNAKALKGRSNSRRRRVLDMASRTGIVILNTGSMSTFRRAGYSETIPDISLATEIMMDKEVLSQSLERGQQSVDAIPGGTVTPAQSEVKGEAVDRIVDILFPTHPKESADLLMPEDPEVPPFIEAELRRAAGTLKNKKALRPDGLQAEVLKAVARNHLKLLLNIYNSLPVFLLVTLDVKNAFNSVRWMVRDVKSLLLGWPRARSCVPIYVTLPDQISR